MTPEQTWKATGRRRGVSLAALALGALVLAAAGCGGDDEETLTKAQVIEQGGEICAEAERMAEQLPLPESKDPFGEGSSKEDHRLAREYLVGFAEALEFSHDGLQGLAAPEEDRELLDGYLAEIGTAAEQLRAAATAPAVDVDEMANEAIERFQRAGEQTKAYGFPKDVCGE